MFTDPPPSSALDISEEDLWSSLRVRRDCPAPELLQSAIDHGLARRRARAYAALAAYHRVSLADEWAHHRDAAAKARPMQPEALRDVLGHKFNCWHKQSIQFGKRIDWNPPGLSSVAGFHYFGFFRPVVTHYLRTGCEESGRFIVDIVAQYKAYQTGANWTPRYQWIVYNQLGASHKFESWLPAYLGVINQGKLPVAAAESFIKHFLGFGRAMKAGNREFIAHNIATHGCRCLMTIARLFPEFREAPGWDRLGTKRMYEQAVKGFNKVDGGHHERVWGYGSYTLRSLGEAYNLGQRYGGFGEYDRPMLAGIRRAYRFYAKSLGPAPHYAQPLYGDGGPGSMLSVLKRGQGFFRVGTNVSLGVDRRRSYLLRGSGFAIMRNGDDDRTTYANLNYGKYAGWHSHQDLLSMNVWAYGAPVLEEVGRFGPYEMPLSTLFRAPEGHNLLTIDGMVYNCQDVRGEDVAWHSDAVADYFTATHYAYQYFCYGRGERAGNSPNIEAKVRRTVVFVKDPGYFLVLDSVVHRGSNAPFNNAITQNWHSANTFRKLSPTQLATKGKAGCILAFARADGLARLETGCDFTAAEGEQWGDSYDRYHARARRWMPLGYTDTVGFATLIFPYRGKRPTVCITAVDAPTATWWRADTYSITTPAGTDTITVNPEGIIAGPRASVVLDNDRGNMTVD